MLLSCAAAQETPLVLNGSARLTDGRLVLTPLEPDQRGAVWTAPLPVADGFETTFRFRVDRPASGDVADGFAFVLQASPDGEHALGGLGQALGYGANAANGQRGIENSLAVELDLFQNRDPSGLDRDNHDPRGEHVAVMSRGQGENSCDHRHSLAETAEVPPLADGAEHTVDLRYLPGSLSMAVDGRVVLQAAVRLDELLALPGGTARVGFTAGTGGGTHSTSILEWRWGDRVLHSGVGSGNRGG